VRRFPPSIRTSGLLVVVALALMALAVVVINLTQDDGSLDRVRATGVLRVGLDASFPPFEWLDDKGDVVGCDADLARLIAAPLGAKPQFVNIGFDGLYEALKADRVDIVISGLPYDERRTRDVAYSQSYFNAGQLLVVLADAVFTPDQEADPSLLLAGRRVTVEWGSMGDMRARQLQKTADGMQVLPQPGAEAALAALLAGSADAAIGDAVSVHQFMGAHHDAVRIVRPLTDEPYVIASPIESRRLSAAIDAELSRIRQSGVLSTLQDRCLQGG